MTTPLRKSAYEMILDWAPSRPLWQQDALRRIVPKGDLTPADILELVQLCHKEHGAPGISAEAVPLTPKDVPVRITAGGTITLSSIANVTRTNRLAPGQTLNFSPTGLTIVYGDNGVGKSGYARILKRACRARFSGAILPDAFDTGAVQGASASIAYADGGVPMPAVGWSDSDTPHHVLAAVSVFDRDCAAVHIREHNEVAFRPFGLDIPDALAAACLAVKEALSEEQAKLAASQAEVFSTPEFSAATPAGKILGNLKPDTDLTPLRALSILTTEDLARLDQLNEDLARDPLRAAAEQRARAATLRQFADLLDTTLAATADEPLSRLMTLAHDARDKRAAAGLAAEVAFGGAEMPGIGGKSWRVLWEAARSYAETAAYPRDAYPPEDGDALCVLCNQPLSDPAINRLRGFDAFVKADVEQRAQTAERLRDEAKEALLSKPIRIAAFPLRRQLSVSAPSVAKSVLHALAAARLRRAACLAGLTLENDAALPATPANPVESVRQLAAKSLAYAGQLGEAANADGRKHLENERDALRDRKALSVLLPKAEIEVVRLANLARVAKCLTETNTKAITTLGNNIADEVITPRVRDRFQEEIQKLAASRVRVDIVRSGGKYGSPQYQVRLFANDKAKVHSVLSEGEQTCVALAVFLTELAMAPYPSALVFDDPVSSLDHRWRQKVAERLVAEAGNRQIIVFTHDLVFLNDLQSLASRATIPHKEISLTQTGAGAGIVTDGLPWVGQRVVERLDNLEKQARSAARLFDAHDEEAYAAEVASFYNRLRSTWERALEDVAFCNVINRHRDYINAKDLKKVVVLNESDVAAWAAGFQICCDITDSHDPSRGRNAASPPPADLLKHVQELSAWVTDLRDRHKAIW